MHKRDDWSPDGQHIVFVDEEAETMWIANLDGSPSRQLAGCDHDGCDQPAWSPDGKRIAFSRYENGAQAGPAAVGIEVLDLNTGLRSKVIRLARPLLADVPRWSPDGTRLVIGVDRMDDAAAETGSAIAIVPVKGGKLTYLTTFDQYAYAPDWSPRGDLIVFGTPLRDVAPDAAAGAAAAWDVWTIKTDGSGLRRVTHAATGEHFLGAKWTPDGSRILAYSTSTGAVSIDPMTGAKDPIAAPPNTLAPRGRPL